MSRAWVLLSGEYPPHPGGVADYTRAVAEGLAERGHEVHVVAPRSTHGAPAAGRVQVHLLEGRFRPRDLLRLDALLATLGPRRLFLQYVPHAFGYKALNLPLCAWLAARSGREELWTQFHEVAFPYQAPAWRRTNLLAAGHRAMAALVCRASSQRFVTTPRWERLLAPLGGLPARVLPVPSNVATELDPQRVAGWRARVGVARGVPLIGHFGTYGRLLSPVLRETFPRLLAQVPGSQVLLLGRSGPEFAAALRADQAWLGRRVHAPGELDALEVAQALGACDLLVQPYEDGVTSRRGSLMAGLGLGVPVLTSEAEDTDPRWRAEGAVALSALDPGALAAEARALLAAPERLTLLGARGRELYRERFALERTLETLELLARD